MRKLLCILTVCGLLGLVLSGCGGTQSASNGDALQGDIAISGAWALYPMVVTWSEEFQKVYPDVQFDISAGGAGKGMADALGGAVDIGMVSRDIQPVEVEQGAFPRAGDARRRPAHHQREQPPPGPPASRRRDASRIEGHLAAARSPPGARFSAIRRSPTKSTSTPARTPAARRKPGRGILGGLKQEDLQGVAVYGDPGLASAVTQDPLGIGYNNLNFAYDADSGKPVEGLQIMPLDRNDNAAIDAAEDFYADKTDVMAAIADGRYPSPPRARSTSSPKASPAASRWPSSNGCSPTARRLWNPPATSPSHPRSWKPNWRT